MSRNDSGWIKEHRSLLNWRWFKDPNTAHLWHYLLLRASWLDEEQEFRTIKIKKGQVLESLPSLSKNTGLTCMNVRTALNHLKSTGEITDELTGCGRLITIVNYAKYQAADSQGNRESNRESNRDLTGT